MGAGTAKPLTCGAARPLTVTAVCGAEAGADAAGGAAGCRAGEGCDIEGNEKLPRSPADSWPLSELELIENGGAADDSRALCALCEEWAAGCAAGSGQCAVDDANMEAPSCN